MSDRKNILLIATGGTIASKKSDNGLKPQISPEELMQYIPQVKDICDFQGKAFHPHKLNLFAQSHLYEVSELL